VLDLNGLLVKRWHTRPRHVPTAAYVAKKWVLLRKGWVDFLQNLFTNFHVGIWSSMERHNIMPILEHMEHMAGRAYNWFIVWTGQECYQENGFYHPDKPDVPARLKRLNAIYTHTSFIGHIIPSNCLLIDDSAYKACLNISCTGIFPNAFHESEKEDFLNTTLWPYLQRMDGDVMDYIRGNPFGQPEVTISHPHYTHFAPLIRRLGSKGQTKGLLGGVSQEATSRLSINSRASDSKHVASIRRKGNQKQRLGHSLSRGEIIVLSQLYGLEKSNFSETEGRKYVKSTFQ